MKKSFATIKPWYYLFAFFIALPYAMVNDGDRVYHWRYLIAYALLGCFVASYRVRSKIGLQSVHDKKVLNKTETVEEWGKKVLSLILQVIYAWLVSSLYTSALGSISGEGAGTDAVFTLLLLLLVVALQKAVVLRAKSQVFTDVRTAVYWLATCTMLLVTVVFSGSGLYSVGRYSTAEMLTALGIALPFIVGGYFVMKVRAADTRARGTKK